jgi:hypothetical protein
MFPMEKRGTLGGAASPALRFGSVKAATLVATKQENNGERWFTTTD